MCMFISMLCGNKGRVFMLVLMSMLCANDSHAFMFGMLCAICVLSPGTASGLLGAPL